MDHQEIGGRIRSLRESLGFKRERAAQCLGITPRYLYDIELGNKGFSIDLLIAMAEVFSVSTDYILLGQCNNVGPYPDIEGALNYLGDDFTSLFKKNIQLFCEMKQGMVTVKTLENTQEFAAKMNVRRA